MLAQYSPNVSSLPEGAAFLPWANLKAKPSNYAYVTGHLAEDKAQSYLESKGYNLLARRFKTPHGEIDLVMSSSEGLHFVEVKQRKTLELAAQSISNTQKKRITQAAEAFLVEYIQPYSFISFDVVLICSQNNIEHLPHAFESEY